MLFKTIIGALLLSFSCLSAALPPFSDQECAELAEQVFAAQSLLNTSPDVFAALSEKVAAQGEIEGMNPELYAILMAVVKKMRAGDDPKKVGMVVFYGCKNALKTT